jgi:nitrogen fixation protein FixH
MADDLFSHHVNALPYSVRTERSEPRELTGRVVLALLLAFFGVIFFVNGILVHKALSTFGGVETDSPYHEGQMYESEVAMAKAQDAQHWQVNGQVTTAADGSALIDIAARDAAGKVLAGMDAAVSLERPTDRRMDRAIVVNEDRPGHFRGSASVAAGQWDLVIELSRQGERQFRSVNRIVLH